MLDPIFVGLAEAARFLGCGRSTFYKLIAAGRVQAVKQGRRTLVSVSSLRGYAATLPPYNIASDVGVLKGAMMSKQYCSGIATSHPDRPTEVDPLLLSVNDAGRLLGISRPSVYKLLAAGKVSAVKLGGRTLVRMESLRAYVDTLASYPVTANVVEEA